MWWCMLRGWWSSADVAAEGVEGVTCLEDRAPARAPGRRMSRGRFIIIMLDVLMFCGLWCWGSFALRR